jgi:hypothetical protein
MTARVLLLAVLGVLCAGSSARADEQLMTLYSPPIKTSPYVHDTHWVGLRANGVEAPDVPGYVTGFAEQVLVDSKAPDAKPLDNAKMMIHHFLYYAPGRVDEAPGGCWQGQGYIAGRGEEHPSGDFSMFTPPAARARYGINNRLPDGRAPDWRLMAMIMNHVKKPKTVYVRTKIWYTTEPRESVMRLVVGDCSTLGNGMAYDVPGGGLPGADYVNASDFTVPFNARVLTAASHQHGGGKHQTLESVSCGRTLFDAPVYHGAPNHIYNTIRPILHEPGPVANGTFQSMEGVPIAAGEVLRRRAFHENTNLHVASMGFWSLSVVRDDSVARCGPIPGDVRDVARPASFDPTPNYALRVPQLAPPARGRAVPVGSRPLRVDDVNVARGRVWSRAGDPVTWRFRGFAPHSVTVTTGPRGFSSPYAGRVRGDFTFTPKVKGTYRLTCLIHPTTMGQTLEVR